MIIPVKCLGKDGFPVYESSEITVLDAFNPDDHGGMEYLLLRKF
jgi:hypothetical protein